MKLFQKGKKVEKMASGGIADPIAGVGIQYFERKPDVPSIDAAQLFAEQQMKQNEYLEQERLKRKPSRAAIMDNISKMSGNAGEKKAFQDALVSQLDEYDKRSRQDPNWVFTEDGTDSFSELINNSIDPARIQELANNHSLVQSGYDSLSKNNSLDSYQIDNGQILAKNAEGATSMVPLSALSQGYTPVTGRDRYQAITTAPKYNHATDGLVQMANKDQAVDQLLSSFDKVTGMVGGERNFVQFSSNKGALRAAKRQAADSMSSATRSALQADFIQAHGGVYNQKEFEDYVDGILDQEVTKKLQENQQVDYGALLSAQKATAAKEEKDGVDPFATPIFQEYNDNILLNDSDYEDADIQVHVFGNSAQSVPADQANFDKIKFTGKLWAIGGDSDNNFSAKETTQSLGGSFSYGQPKETTIDAENAKLTGRYLIPVTTGPVYDENQNKVEELPEGSIIIKTGVKSNRNYQYNYGNSVIPDYSKPQKILRPLTDDKGQVIMDRTTGSPVYVSKTVIKRKDGKFVEVKLTPVNAYEFDDDGHRQTVFEPMTPVQSLNAFRVNMSDTGKPEFFDVNNRINFSAGSDVDLILKKIKAINPAYYGYVMNELISLKGQPAVPQIKDRVNEVLGAARKEIQDRALQTLFSAPKADYTQNDSGADTMRGARATDH